MDILDTSHQLIHCKVSNNLETIIVTICYGHNAIQDRIKLWESLMNCAKSAALPWIVMGDFNAIRWENEKFGGSKSNNTSMQNFNDCIDHCGLLELNLANPLFT